VCEGRIGDKNRRISGAARGMHYWDRMAGTRSTALMTLRIEVFDPLRIRASGVEIAQHGMFCFYVN
jgi:hypothetical protein